MLSTSIITLLLTLCTFHCLRLIELLAIIASNNITINFLKFECKKKKIDKIFAKLCKIMLKYIHSVYFQ